MPIVNGVRRFVSFFRRKGFRSTVARCIEAVRRMSYLGRMVLYRSTLSPECCIPTNNSGAEIQRVSATTASGADLELISRAWSPAIKKRQINERFKAGGELWLVKRNERLAGYGWTIRGRTIDPYYFPLEWDEAHLFDFYVFPEFRGCGLNVCLVSEILAALRAVDTTRAFIECAAWNHSQIRSLTKTAFRKYAEATKLQFFGRPAILWHKPKSRSCALDRSLDS
jgi:GNAT superfamily N-acetyltransferase